jgi:ABC-2 type transport system ATP-binding protein
MEAGLALVLKDIGWPMSLLVHGLSKVFKRPVISGLNLSIAPGEFYALLGPNGAGKTTTLRMIAGLLKPDAGEISVCGIDVLKEPLAAKAMMAWLPDEPLLYDRLTPLEYLAFVAGLWRVAPEVAKSRAEEWLEVFGLWAQRHERCEGFSRGMKQKVILAGALIHEPKLFILDEPLTGLDAAAARLVKSILQSRAEAGAAIILTTHILDTAQHLATRIGILAGGMLRAEGSFEELQAAHEGGTLEDVFLRVTSGSV